MASPLRIHRFEEAGCIKFKAAASMDKLFHDAAPLERQLEAIEMAYTIALAGTCKALEMSKIGTKTDPRAYWFAAEKLKEFTGYLIKMGFYLEDENDTFARDLEIAKSSLIKIRSFYNRMPDILQIDPSITWNFYRENKAPLQKSRPGSISKST